MDAVIALVRKQSKFHGLVVHDILDHSVSGEARVEAHYNASAPLGGSVAGSLNRIAEEVRLAHPDC